MAQAKLERLQKVGTISLANKDGILQTPGAATFWLGDSYEPVVCDGYTGVELRRDGLTVTKLLPDLLEINHKVIAR